MLLRLAWTGQWERVLSHVRRTGCDINVREEETGHNLALLALTQEDVTPPEVAVFASWLTEGLDPDLVNCDGVSARSYTQQNTPASEAHAALYALLA